MSYHNHFPFEFRSPSTRFGPNCSSNSTHQIWSTASGPVGFRASWTKAQYEQTSACCSSDSALVAPRPWTQAYCSSCSHSWYVLILIWIYLQHFHHFSAILPQPVQFILSEKLLAIVCFFASLLSLWGICSLSLFLSLSSIYFCQYQKFWTWL